MTYENYELNSDCILKEFSMNPGLTRSVMKNIFCTDERMLNKGHILFIYLLLLSWIEGHVINQTSLHPRWAYGEILGYMAIRVRKEGSEETFAQTVSCGFERSDLVLTPGP